MRIVSYTENPEAVEITAKVLNDPAPPGKVYVLPVPGPGLSSLHFGEESAELFRRNLGELVTEWLHCGKKIMPTKSEVWATGAGPVPPYSTETKWTQFLVPEGMGRKKRESLKPVDESDPAFNSWLWKVYWDYLWRFKPTIWFNSYGEVFFQYMTPMYQVPHDSPTALPPFLRAEDGNTDAWLEAVLWFILLLNSGHAHLLDHCQFCRRFFVRARAKKCGQVYKRGPSCGNCKGADSRERTRAVRDDAKGQMLKVAAKAWAGWKQSHRTPDRYLAVAGRLNSECRREILVTTRRDTIEPLWVKRNEKGIVRLAEQLTANNGGKRNAKG